MSARDRILAKLRAGAPSENRSEPDVAGWFASHRPVETAVQKVARFRSCIELAHAEVHAVTPNNWLGKLHAVLHARGVDKILVAEGTAHGDAALDRLPPQGIECSTYDIAIEAWKSELFNATPASLTAARAAIAETGTLILWPDEHEPRLMSLVPPVHIVLLDAAAIYNTFFEAMQAEGWKDGLPTNALLISGPSKTADIQQTLAYGAHGPKELIVLLIGDEQ
ncbi:LutC/YkgG family protein [Dechloromonas denitrificans]|uniref:LutC/YkgG family protein n=1 Tax=Dechloromonas denitrificans TaxID=281362 RepID=UPI001CF84321|nr:LUD domain-containing protein [Dechloromonas denitrificans]UCV02243.1 LUD domain-containing protein [Dechloromonas denitrificans]